MWNRQDLKRQAKAAFKANYWRCVLVALVLSLVTGSALTGQIDSVFKDEDDSVGGFSYQTTESVIHSGHYSSTPEYEIDPFFSQTPSLLRRFGPVAAAVVGVAALSGTLVSLFVFAPLEIGGCRFFAENAVGNGQLDFLGHGFRYAYLRNVLAMFLRGLFTMLWGLLLFFPGVMAFYSYRLVPFLLADYPELGAKEALDVSRDMMRGHKWDAFMLDLSFIGWEILNGFTGGILGVFYVKPYECAARAELYLTLVQNQSKL